MKKLVLKGEDAVGEYSYTLLDDEDYEKYCSYDWYITIVKTYEIDGVVRDRTRWQIRIWSHLNNFKRTFQLCRMIMDAPKDLVVDHKDHNQLNNQKSNLRICTESDNQKHRRPTLNKSSKYLGCCWRIEQKAWCAGIRMNKSGSTYIGSFKTEVEAAVAYDLCALKYHGEFANLNFPENIEEYKLKLDDVDVYRRKERSSKFRGVYTKIGSGVYRAKIGINKKIFYLGSFKDEIEAAKAYDKAVIEFNQDRRWLNFKEEV